MLLFLFFPHKSHVSLQDSLFYPFTHYAFPGEADASIWTNFYSPKEYLIFAKKIGVFYAIQFSLSFVYGKLKYVVFAV